MPKIGRPLVPLSDKICMQCNCRFNRTLLKGGFYEWPSLFKRRKFCSNNCKNKHKEGIPLNTNTKLKISNAIISGMKMNGEHHPMWKGDDVGYTALHYWAKYRLQKPERCEWCNIKHPVDLANKSGNYKRDTTDWLWLCRRCHMIQDGRLDNFILRTKLRHLNTRIQKSCCTGIIRGFP